jgi:hypothetical protein
MFQNIGRRQCRIKNRVMIQIFMYVCMQERFGAVVDYLESVTVRDDSPERAACESVSVCLRMCICECMLKCAPGRTTWGQTFI